MIFPDLALSEEEKSLNSRLETKLLATLNELFDKEYRSNPRIKISGSTNKGTALPDKYFGTDIDATVEAEGDLLKRIAYQSNIFEGCQIFSIPFFERFSKYFGGAYFAGHRLSGEVGNRNFDFSITDSVKDKWKWDMNSSRYLQFSQIQKEEVKKLKFFLKRFNVSGSEINGIVGPAAELLVHYYGELNNVLKTLNDSLIHLPEDFSNSFGTQEFPKEFYGLFPKTNDYVHEGLIKSFKFTTPNTFNRLLECLKIDSLEIKEFTNQHLPQFRYSRNLNTDHNKLVAYFLGTFLKGNGFFHIDVLPNNRMLSIYADASNSQAKLLETICNKIEAFQSNREFNYRNCPNEIRKDLELKCDDPERYTFFIGSPMMPLQRERIYVPFDFLLREDCSKLIKVISGGQNVA